MIWQRDERPNAGRDWLQFQTLWGNGDKGMAQSHLMMLPPRRIDPADLVRSDFDARASVGRDGCWMIDHNLGSSGQED